MWLSLLVEVGYILVLNIWLGALIPVVAQVVAAGANLVLITRGIEKTIRALVSELKSILKEVEDSELADVAAVSAGNNNEIGNMIADAMSKGCRKGVNTLEARNRNKVSNLHRNNNEPV
ncbi:Chaperonin 60 subunit beta 1, chloroplastic -like protein [Gossypium arboreum]|uniref:Chaperonin 60 subunit beta 1, chloroplastic-like protein n=1 Tax=Gossypium arboreum TaxID=29729 RepID=A0A0B0NI82_GOSAR|nr:Chaperonin 60 subunit beta 1, chloroplastic -like protein [Gossypium arboreum]